MKWAGGAFGLIDTKESESIPDLALCGGRRCLQIELRFLPCFHGTSQRGALFSSFATGLLCHLELSFQRAGNVSFPCMSTDRCAEDGVLWNPCGMNVCAQWKEIPPLQSSCAAFYQLGSGQETRTIDLLPQDSWSCCLCHILPWCPTKYSILGFHSYL